jgi:spore germination protein YaaH
MTKNVSAWLRMASIAGTYPIPSSEVSYFLHENRFNNVMPLNGGALDIDGTWIQDSNKLGDFAADIYANAVSSNKIYAPVITFLNRTAGETILSSPILMQTSADNLVTLLSTRPLDSPWKAVDFDFEGVDKAYKNNMTAFCQILTNTLRNYDPNIYISTSLRGKTNDPGVDYGDAYLYDFDAVLPLFDMVNLYCYGYWNPTDGTQRSIAPYWWIEDCIKYALAHGGSHNKIILGLVTYSKYQTTALEQPDTTITYDQAITIINTNGSSLEWIDSNVYGRVEEKVANLPIGRLWVADRDSYRNSLELVNQYDLAGHALFVLGMEDSGIWNVMDNFLGIHTETSISPCINCPCTLDAWMWCPNAFIKTKQKEMLHNGWRWQ